MSTCFALLDDHTASAESPSSRLYTALHSTLHYTQSDGLPVLLAHMQDALQQGLHAVVLFDYELGEALHGITPHAQASGDILLFKECHHLSRAATDTWLAEQAQQSDTECGIARITPSVTESAFHTAIDTIRAYIAAGDTYQVNYTFRLRFDAYGDVIPLYQALRQLQPVPYGACIQLPDGRAVLSLSPELFIRHQDGVLTARPMKGTAAATDNPDENTARAQALSQDNKNRAENLMIVDLLRNDISRIAKLGSVRVPHLFDVTRFSQVLQMTSTIQAELRDDATLHEIIHALYPCGSITGAPKRRTMEIIRELETDARHLYTGAIGWFEPTTNNHTVSNFCLSVPIRTLTLQAPVNGIRAGEMGVGAGIVYDSHPAEEYAECLLKARFLTRLQPDFQLFETIYATKETGCRHLSSHLARLATSATYFGFTLDSAHITTTLQQTIDALPPNTPHRVRLALSANGQCSVQTGVLQALTLPVKVFIADDCIDHTNLFLRHKSTVRARYDQAWREAESRGGFDMLFFNTDGYLTEGGRSNVFVRLDGQWFTPPLSAGILPGVMRAQLLRDPAYAAQEKNITRNDLMRAEDVIVCNALRDAIHASVDTSSQITQITPII
jgi:para-aminobenzoate synthetase/4-amino-4-deoxychorismate lyase